jgi:hypothetical protein
MPHSELLFIDRDGYAATQRAVISGKTLSGDFQLSIRAKSNVGAHCKQAYTLTYTGLNAELFYSCHHTRLTKGQPLRAHWDTQQAINGTILAHAKAISLEPTSAQAKEQAQAHATV